MSNILELRDNIKNIIDKNTNLIGTESDNLITEYGVEDSKEMSNAITMLENENRLLQIGIVGRVKAGKSSLLNALLFNGKSILPKAATPMTAALTQLSYGEDVSADVEFFSQEDITKIKNEASKYKKALETQSEIRFQELKKRKEKKGEISSSDLSDLKEKAKKQADRALKENISLSASYDQFDRMQKSGIDSLTLDNSKTINSSSIEDLSSKLLEYVGSSGRYMPFTKSVHIKLPQDNLKDIMIIDTPGVNDPVQSREARTRELLKYCDVIFIVSPSGQFLSSEDIELMDRITAKEGVQEIIVISSQVDTQLLGSMKEEYGGDLPAVLNGITSSLGEHLSSTLTQLKNKSPEIGTTFDKLITQGKSKVIHSSGICQTIKEGFNEKESWDDGAKKVWENLTREYSDYFSDNDETLSVSNLDMLGNISTVNEIISDVRLQKDDILSKRKDDFIKAKHTSLIKYKDDLLSFANEQIEKVKNGDAEELKKDKENLKKIQEKASTALDEEYFDLVEELSININKTLTNELHKNFKDTRKSVDESEGTKSEDYQQRVGNKFLWWGDKYETRTRSVVSVRTGAVRSFLENLTMEIENSIQTSSQSFVLDWKKQLLRGLVKVLRESADDDDLDPQVIRKTVRSVINTVKYPNIDYSNDLKASSSKKETAKPKGMFGFFIGNTTTGLDATGTLTNSDAEEYLDKSRDYLSSLKRRVTKSIKTYLTSLEANLKKINPSEKIFGSYKERIEELERQIENKEITIDSLERLIKQLGEIN